MVGVANRRSLAAAAVTALTAPGIPVLVTWQDQRHADQVAEVVAADPLAQAWRALDLTDTRQVAAMAAGLPPLSGVVHAVAFGRLQDEAGGPQRVIDSDQERFAECLSISAHSLAQLCRACEPQLQPGAGVVALSYLGATRWLPGYNLMGVAKAALEAEVRYLAGELGPRGVRVNAVSAGPVRTLASSGVPGFRRRLDEHAARAPLQRGVTSDEVGEAVAFLVSARAGGITGQVVHVDAGSSIAG